jgi:histidyl-tRNA synthetase
MGLERVLMVMEQQGCPFPAAANDSVFFAPIGEEASLKAAELTRLLRAEGFAAEYELMARSLKAQMKYADKLLFKYTAVIGGDELESGRAVLKNMLTGAQREIPLGDGFIEAFYALSLDEAVAGAEQASARAFQPDADKH